MNKEPTDAMGRMKSQVQEGERGSQQTPSAPSTRIEGVSESQGSGQETRRARLVSKGQEGAQRAVGAGSQADSL